tara:strand:+ start:275 stop:538 length:264 start_codon:yes stop_codon:yes gene_type:complete
MKRKAYERNRRLMPGFKVKPLKKMRKNMSVEITKEKFDEYKEVQMSGAYNMFDPQARAMTNLSKEEWVTIMQEYEKLNEAWGDKDES